jgi:3-methylfumaryl-CoA hydratase
MRIGDRRRRAQARAQAGTCAHHDTGMKTDWQDWIGRTFTREDVISAWPLTALAATLDRDDEPSKPGDPLPPLAHWLYFLPVYRESDVGPDGHARRGAFLPPVPLQRRMWAGGRLSFEAPLRVGDTATRVSRIVDIVTKEGRSGPLVFVVVRHTVRTEAGVAIVEEHDIVYRDAASAAIATSPPAAPVDAAWTHEIEPDPVLLFRYSALTFNSHRIHYDRRYVTDVEGYPGLIVHGPLIATLLADLLRRARPRARVSRFTFRAVSPLFDTQPFFVRGHPAHDDRSVHLWAANVHGGLAMDATAALAPA